MRFKFKVGNRVVYQGGLVTITARSLVKTVGMFTLPDGGPFYTIDGNTIVRQAQFRLPETLPVIFRADKSGAFKGQVTAVFPTMCEDYQGRVMSCYAHVGQHGAASFGWYLQSTRAAKPDEYADLLRELRGIYERSHGEPEGSDVFTLQVACRMTAAHRRAFESDLQRTRATMRDCAA